MTSEKREPRLTIATRGSQLALWQAEHVRGLLQAKEPGLVVELLVLKTTGDRIVDRPLYEVGGKGLFTKEIEEALLSGAAQVAVHSMKDMPALSPDGLVLAAVPPRQDPRDALLLSPALRGAGLVGLPQGARVGTTSLRRICQIKGVRPDLVTEPLRGNVDTRLRRLGDGEMDAIVLAAAGLFRLGHEGRIDELLDMDLCVPAVGQGALALQCRRDDEATIARLLRLGDAQAWDTTSCERAFLQELGGDCRTPLGAHARLCGDEIELTAFVCEVDGSRHRRGKERAPRASAVELGAALARTLRAG